MSQPRPCSHPEAASTSQETRGRYEYRPRDPADSVIVQILEKHLERFFAATESEDGPSPLPAFVREGLLAVRSCADLSRGFLRYRCDRCAAPRIVPFSCKNPICSSCSGRRMAARSMYLVDRVMPKVPYRQWVVSLPFELRMLVAFDSDVANAVFRIATSAIFGAVESLAAEDGVLGTPAGILHIQRFSDGTMLNVHGHFVVSDGVFAEVPTSGRTHESDPGPPKDPVGPALDVLFQPTRAPTLTELADVAMAIEHGVRRYLTRRASQRHSDDGSPDIEASRAREVLERLARAKPIAERTSSGEGPASSHSKPAVAKLAARSPAGFDVHAGVAIAAHARTALEKLLAYLARPPVPSSRLRLLKNGNVAFDCRATLASSAASYVGSRGENVGVSTSCIHRPTRSPDAAAQVPDATLLGRHLGPRAPPLTCPTGATSRGTGEAHLAEASRKSDMGAASGSNVRTSGHGLPVRRNLQIRRRHRGTERDTARGRSHYRIRPLASA